MEPSFSFLGGAETEALVSRIKKEEKEKMGSPKNH
jgi:hypothetical protein